MSPYPKNGFTLLETIVALSLFAIIGGMLLSWLNTNLMAISKIESAELRIEAIQNAREYMAHKNPVAEPEGEEEFGPYQLKWHSTPLSEEFTVMNNQSGRYGMFKAQLFQTIITISGANLSEYTFVIEQLGHRKFRESTGSM